MQRVTHEIQRSDRSTSEEADKDKLKKVDGDFSVCKRHKKDNNNDTTRKNEDLKGKGGWTLKYYNVDGDESLFLIKTEEKTKTTVVVIKRITKKKKKAEAVHWTKRRMEVKAKWQVEAKICATILRESNTMKVRNKKKNKDVTFIVLLKNMRSMHSSERIEEMIYELEDYRWNEVLLNEA